MVNESTTPLASTSESRSIPTHKCLGRTFSTFDDYWKELTKTGGILDNVPLKNVVKKDDDGKEIVDVGKTQQGLWNATWGITAKFIAGNFYRKFRNRNYYGEEEDFILEFNSELAMVIAEIRRKEFVWSNVYREIGKIIKIDRTETQRTSGTDKGGKTTNGDNAKYQVLSKELTEKTAQHGTVSSFSQEGSTTSTTNKGTNYIPLGKILSSLSQVQFDFPSFYKRFDHFWPTYCAPTLEWVIDKTTGRRKWVTEEEYIEIVEPEKAPSKQKLGPDAFAVLDEYQKTRNWDKYLEALQIYHQQTEKEHDKLPDTSNRKPRLANRVKIGNGLIEAYKTFKTLPTVEVFRKRIGGTVEYDERGNRIVYQKVIGYENIIEIVEDYLRGWSLSRKYGLKPPRQLMIALLGPPGLGKTYISAIIAKALGISYTPISLNGKNSARIIYGENMANPGSDPGEIVKAISRSKDQNSLLLFDEIEKAGREAKFAIGNPTDRTQNWLFKDDFYDFPTPCHTVIFFAALNYPEDLPDFVGDRFRKINVNPLNYVQRIEVVKLFIMKELIDYEKIWATEWGKTAQQMFELLNKEELLKKTLTWTFSIRGAEKNVNDSLIPALISLADEKKALPSDVVNYNWKFAKREDTEDIDRGDKDRKRMACPYSQDKTQPHRKSSDAVKEGYTAQKCTCFINNLDQVPGWKDNMGDK